MCFDGDPVDLVKAKEQRARKEHLCAECGRTIASGEVYLYEAWVYEGSFDTHRTCGQCHAARRWLVEICSTWQYGWVLNELAEHWDESWWGGRGYRSLGLGRLIIASRTRWQRNGELVPVDRVAAWVDDALRRAPATSRSAA